MKQNVSKKGIKQLGKNRHIFQHYLNMAEIMGKMCSPLIEVVVHDFQDPEHSIIAIYNGHITGRKIEDGISDISLKRLKGEIPDKLSNYQNISPSGKKLKSSTLAIRDDEGKLIGSFGLNMDISYFLQMDNVLQQFISHNQYGFLEEREKFFFLSAKEQIQEVYQNYINNNGLNNKSLNNQEKKALLKNLYENRVFDKKGSITTVSALTGVARTTVYRYIRQAKKYK